MKVALGISVALALSGCGLGDKASQAQADLDALQAEYEAFDLTCDFDDVSASKEDGAASACEDAEKQFAILVEEFDADGDGKLSDEELAEAEQGFEDARKAEVDKNGDGQADEGEKAAWKAEKAEGRKEKRDEKFKAACEKFKKAEEECKGLHGQRKGELKQKIEARKAEFDKNGDGKIDEAEQKAKQELLRAERDKKKEEVKKKHDKDGDGKISGDERNDRREQRKPGMPPQGQGKGPQGGATPPPNGQGQGQPPAQAQKP